jgi:hypothetical protein
MFSKLVISALAIFSFRVWAQGACPRVDLDEVVAPAYGWTAGQLLSALEDGNAQVESWLAERSKQIDGHMVYGPNLDGTYFYRLGEAPEGEAWAWGKKLVQRRQDLLQQGFPRLNPSELSLINLTNNRARAIGAPNTWRCAKHFPGGDENLELTEDQAMIYTDPEQVRKFEKTFELVLRGENPPECMMLGHAQYPAEAFGQKTKVNLGPMLGAWPFSDVPASLNPGIVKELRQRLGFKGLIIDDWLDMGAVNKFLARAGSRARLSRALTAFYIGTYADVDLMPAVYIGSPQKLAGEIRAKLKPEWRVHLEQHLHAWAADYFARLGLASALAKNLSLEALITLKTVTVDNPKDAEIMRTLLPNQVSDRLELIFNKAGDAWNRSGVLVLLERQAAVESLLRSSRLAFQSVAWPAEVKDESNWFQSLSAPTPLNRAMQAIDWDGERIQNLFCHVRQDRFSRTRSSSL